MLWDGIAGLLTGILSGFGVGGGSLLNLWLTMVRHVSQFSAGGLNLLYFISCAPTALWSHIKNGLIERRAALWCTLAGIPTSILAAIWAGQVDVHLLRKGFGILLLYIGIKEVRCKSVQKDTQKEAEKHA